MAVAASPTGFAVIGLFVPTPTNSGIAATVGLLITVQILDTVPQLDALGPHLFPRYWLSFVDLLREPVHWDGPGKNLATQGAYAAVFGSTAWARCTGRDITV